MRDDGGRRCSRREALETASQVRLRGCRYLSPRSMRRDQRLRAFRGLSRQLRQARNRIGLRESESPLKHHTAEFEPKLIQHDYQPSDRSDPQSGQKSSLVVCSSVQGQVCGKSLSSRFISAAALIRAFKYALRVNSSNLDFRPGLSSRLSWNSSRPIFMLASQLFDRRLGWNFHFSRWVSTPSR